MPYKECMAVLTDIGTEELAHLEMVCTIVHQLTRGMSMEELKESGIDAYYVDHTAGIWPQAASGSRSPRLRSSLQEIRSPTSRKTSLRNRKPGRHTIT